LIVPAKMAQQVPLVQPVEALRAGSAWDTIRAIGCQ